VTIVKRGVHLNKRQIKGWGKMLDLFQATNVQEDQQITILLRSLRKEMNTMTPKEHK
jgi:hypothetical protein